MIIAPFNPVWLLSLAVTLFLIWPFKKYAEKHTREQVNRVYLVMHIICIVFFYIYKNLLAIDQPYIELMIENDLYLPVFFNEQLLCHLCNMQMFMVPIAVYTRKKPLCAYCFFITPLGAMLALLMPPLGFSDYSFFLPRMLGFYLTHYFLIFSSISLYFNDIYKPAKKDCLFMSFMMPFAAFLSFMVNMILRWTHLSMNSNYFYTMGPETNFILKMFWDLIPVPYLYVLPIVPIVILFVYLEILAIQGVKRLKAGLPFLTKDNQVENPNEDPSLSN